MADTQPDTGADSVLPPILRPVPESEAELAFEGALRPKSLAEFVGQKKVRGQLQLLLQAAAIQNRTPDRSEACHAEERTIRPCTGRR